MRAAGVRLALLTAALCALAGPARADRWRQEYEVKAAFLYNFARFVTWPDDDGSGRPIVVGIVGEDPFGPMIDRLFARKVVNGRRFVVQRFPSFDHVSQCQILFVGATSEARLAQGLRGIRRQPVLTVGESERFVEDGGVIRLKTVENRVRIVVNVAAADSAGLRLSARLLQVADGLRPEAAQEAPR